MGGGSGCSETREVGKGWNTKGLWGMGSAGMRGACRVPAVRPPVHWFEASGDEVGQGPAFREKVLSGARPETQEAGTWARVPQTGTQPQVPS